MKFDKGKGCVKNLHKMKALNRCEVKLNSDFDSDNQKLKEISSIEVLKKDDIERCSLSGCSFNRIVYHRIGTENGMTYILTLISEFNINIKMKTY